MNYQLHDSQINNLSISKNIVFYFSQGFWETDTTGKEISQKQNCKLIFSIDNEFNNLPLEEFITIRICKRKNIFKPISLQKFLKLLKKSTFDVDMEYDCFFANRKMIQLSSNSLNIAVELFIDDIKNVEYVHD